MRDAHKPYPSDLTDAQWALIEPLIPAAWPGGRPRTADMREVVNAPFYRTREGCTWRALPLDFPPCKTIYNYFQWLAWDGTWQYLLDARREDVRHEDLRAATLAPRPSIASRSIRPRGARGAASTGARR